MTPLHRAAECGHVQIVEILLSKGGEMSSRDRVSTCNEVYIVSVLLYSDHMVMFELRSNCSIIMCMYIATHKEAA